MSAHGIDISSYQGSPDMDKLCSNADFLMMRHSIGLLDDKQFIRNWTQSEGKTLRGIYYVPHPSIKFESAKAKLREIFEFTPDFPIILDIEIAGVYIDLTYGLAGYIYSKTGKYPIIYTSPGFWRGLWGYANGTHQTFFKKCPLWVAHYGAQQPDKVSPWGSDWTFWQYRINNVWEEIEDYGLRYWESKALDMNWYKGTCNELIAWAGADMPVEPTPTDPPQTGDYVMVTDCQWLSFRSRPELYDGDRPAVGAGVLCRVLERQDGWLRVELSGGDTGWINERYTVPG